MLNTLRLFSFLNLLLTLPNLNQLRHIKPVHIMNMRINSSRLLQVHMESLLHKLYQSLFSYINSAIDYLHESSFKGIIDHLLVL